MAPESLLTVGEFERATNKQTALFLNEFNRVHKRLDGYSTRLATVETKVDERTVRASTKQKVGWSTIAAGVGIVVAKVAQELWTK